MIATGSAGHDREGSGENSQPSIPAAAVAAGLVLLVVYLATLAPDVTFWDAGEFIAAARTLGIPHPPGTPLVMLLHNVWAKVLFFVPFAAATNSVSAIATATAGAFSVALLLESAGPEADRRDIRWNAVAGALCAGGMSTVWLNATETEVYSVALALSILMIWAGQRAGRRDSQRWRALTAFLIVLSVPLHLSALVAAPTAAYLASTSSDGRMRWESLVSFAGLFLLTMGFGKMTPAIAVAGFVVMLLAGALPIHYRTSPRRRALATSAAMLAVGAVAASAVLVMLVRARFDPQLNQGNPSTLPALADVIARRQYDVPGMWPRLAPFWLQVANMFQYADWQIALALAPGVIPSVGRVVMTVTFAALGVFGSLTHRGTDRRGWRALAILLLCGSLGIVVYVNFRAGASFGYGILPDNAVREARDRDYFYYLGFWAWGLWAGWGAVALARRLRGPAAVGVAAAVLPIAMNWTVVSRKQQPGAELPLVFAQAILGSAPPHAVLIVGGDNDSYPLWYLKAVHGARPDVAMVTSPLLNALWYQEEVRRRDHLLDVAAPRSELASARLVAEHALAQGRPLAVSVIVPASERNQLHDTWAVHGLVYVATRNASSHPSAAAKPSSVSIDSSVTEQWARWVMRWQRGRHPGLSIDPSDQYYLSVLSCPVIWLQPESNPHRLASLDSLCNRR